MYVFTAFSWFRRTAGGRARRVPDLCESAERRKDAVSKTGKRPSGAEEPPPFLGTWRNVYVFVICYLAVLIAGFYFFSRARPMRPLDWVVMFAWLVFIVSYGLYRGRGSTTVNKFLLAGKSMPWYAMGLSIMATQASAITFISTTGQAYTDGMRFVQFYFGLPIAMVILCATAVPIFHRAKVYTAYEYLEQRFDAKTRALVSGIFLIQRGFAAGLSLYAPAVVLSIVLGWSDRLTAVMMGALIVTYTSVGGIKAVTWADVPQMMLIFCGLLIALVMAIHLLPGGVSFRDAVSLAGAPGD